MAGRRLGQSTADDVGDLVNIGVIYYLVAPTRVFRADPRQEPHPPDGLAILDFGIDDNIKFGMIEAIAHLIHGTAGPSWVLRTLDFIPRASASSPSFPLSRVFDQALEGRGEEHQLPGSGGRFGADAFDYPFRSPLSRALIITPSAS